MSNQNLKKRPKRQHKHSDSDSDFSLLSGEDSTYKRQKLTNFTVTQTNAP